MKLVLPKATHSSSTAYCSRRKSNSRAASVTSSTVATASSHGVTTMPSTEGSNSSRGTYSSTAAGRHT